MMLTGGKWGEASCAHCNWSLGAAITCPHCGFINAHVDSVYTSPERVEKTAESIHDCGGAQHHRYADHIADAGKMIAEPDIEEMTLTQIASRHEPVKQEPVAWVDAKEEGYEFYGISYLPVGKHHLYAAPVSAEAIRAEAKWIDPNDKSQKQYLPHIGEKVLFCCDGEVFYGHHTGGSFQTGQGVTARNFGTWDCFWMHPPAAAIRKLT